eukprot:CAMPEP_0168347198 /NCGR_PEP_ID=MMETSP0213-20121227/18836_1 /TAXON_ID=151035 /ORGANISM="Euplotes harpa, Strain FSP1.4" /LENGTH=34 /DNA_ID= /DNA_START= /DNA_END= /DNA_ORIENTATION=
MDAKGPNLTITIYDEDTFTDDVIGTYTLKVSDIA